MDRLFWLHNEPSGIAGAVLGCRQFLASGQTLANGDDALHVVRLLLVDGMQTYARYDGDFRPVTNRPDLFRLNLRAPTSLRNREILVDVLSLHADLLRKRGLPLRVPAQYTQIQPSLSRVVTSRRFDPVKMQDAPTAEVAPWSLSQPSGGPQIAREAGFLPVVAVAGPAAAWTYVAVTGIVSALVAYIVSKVTDSVDNWNRSRAATDLNLTRQATSYAKLVQTHQDHANAEQKAGRELPYSPGEQALIESARRDLEAGRNDARDMVNELVKPPAGGASTTILLLGLAAVAGLAYTQTKQAAR